MASLGRLVLSLGVIVAALLVVRHWAQRGRGSLRGTAGVRILARTALTRTAVVAVVETDGRRFLVGAAEEGVRLLAELAPDEDQPKLDHRTATGLVTGVDPRRPGAGLPLHPASPTDGGTAPRTNRPGIGLLDRLRAMTVRSHVDRPIRVPLR